MLHSENASDMNLCRDICVFIRNNAYLAAQFDWIIY